MKSARALSSRVLITCCATLCLLLAGCSAGAGKSRVGDNDMSTAEPTLGAASPFDVIDADEDAGADPESGGEVGEQPVDADSVESGDSDDSDEEVPVVDEDTNESGALPTHAPDGTPYCD